MNSKHSTEEKFQIVSKVTVILTAHNRKNYIIAALKSILDNQPKGIQIQIVVVKNFIDTKIDEYIKNKKIVNIYVNYPHLGDKIRAGLLVAEGDVILFLDDDDTFSTNKISRVVSIFNNNPDLVFLHNGYNLIDDFGNPIKRNISLKTEELKILDRNKRQKFLKNIIRKKIAFNTSSISISRNSISNVLKLVDVARNRSDLVLLISCLINDSGKICYTDEVLTNYRIHSDNLSNSRLLEISKYRDFLRISHHSFKGLLKFETGALPRYLVLFYDLDTLIKLHILGDSKSEDKSEEILIVKMMLKSPILTLKVLDRTSCSLFLLYIVSYISPELAKNVYLRARSLGLTNL